MEVTHVLLYQIERYKNRQCQIRQKVLFDVSDIGGIPQPFAT